MITPRQNFRFLIDKALGGPGLTPQARLQDALLARRCRNFYFNAMAPVITDNSGAFPADVIVQAQTKPFGWPMIVTDILNFDEPYVPGFYFGVVFQLMRVFITPDEDFFASGNFTDSLMTLGHYQSDPRVPLVFPKADAPSIKQHFMPYLQKPGTIWQVSWEFLDANTPRHIINPEADFRAVQVLDKDDSYGQLCGRVRDAVCGYINNRDVETTIIDLEIPTTSFPAAGASATFVTPQQERPLLVYGFSTNINGAQVLIRDTDTQWNFCATPVAPHLTIDAGAPVAGVYPAIQGLPINTVLGNGDLTRQEAYNMLPVPHLLAPNTSLAFTLINGLRPDGTTGTYTQTMDTVNNNLFSTGNGHIALLCRTV